MSSLFLIPCTNADEGRQRALDHFGSSDVTITSSLEDLSKRSLFDTEPIIFIAVDREQLIALSTLDMASYTDGFIIVSAFLMTTREMKALAASVKRQGGQVEQRREDIRGMIDELNIGQNTKDFLHAYTIDDYSQTIPLIKEIVDSKKPFTLDDVIARLPQKPGTVVPWGFGRDRGLDELIYARQASAALKKLNRVLDGGTPPIMTEIWLKNQYHEIMDMAALQSEGRSDTEIARMLSLPDPSYRRSGERDPVYRKSGYPTYRKLRTASGMGVNRAMQSMQTIAHADNMLHGDTKACMLSPRNIIIRLVSDLCNLH